MNARIIAVLIFWSFAGITHGTELGKHLQPGFQFGLALGQHTLKASKDGFNFFDEHATAGKLFAGYRINRFFAIEGAYIHGGEMSDSAAGLTLEVDTKALQASVIGSWPLNDYISLFARGAYLDWKADEKISVGGASTSF